jgi:CO/xanthine dehydrogenase FAD-binding subunit
MTGRTYFEPTDLAGACSILAEHQGARIVAGGTDLVVAARSGKARLPDSLVAIHRLEELRGVAASGGGLRIGALSTHGDLESSTVVRRAWSALSDASALVGSPATRHLGTAGGNVSNASPAMELGSPLLVFDASVELASASGTRNAPFGSFVTGPGHTSARPGELVTAIILPAPQVKGRAGSAYVRLEYRQAMEIAVVGAAAMVRLDAAGRCSEARIALTAVAPTCVRAADAEAVLRGHLADPSVVLRAAAAATSSAAPIDDVRAGAGYRRAMVEVIVRRALSLAIERAGGSKVA